MKQIYFVIGRFYGIKINEMPLSNVHYSHIENSKQFSSKYPPFKMQCVCCIMSTPNEPKNRLPQMQPEQSKAHQLHIVGG